MSQTVSLIDRADELGWEPNHPETWTFRYATLRSAVFMRAPHLLYPIYPTALLVQYGLATSSPLAREYFCVSGQIVKIVLVTRAGLVGITDDLTANYGPRAFVELNMLQPCSPPELCDN